MSLAASSGHARDYHPEILSALKHLERSQARTQGPFDPGQWPTNVTAILGPSLAGIGKWGKPYPEATIFTSATIVNVLRQIQEDEPKYSLITPMIDKAIAGFHGYSIPPFYNFYPLRKRNGAWVRGPRNFYIAPYFRGLANIPPDTDSTSVAYLAMQAPLPGEVLNSLVQFRDVERRPHYYNKRIGVVNSGAFMTWLMDEKDPKMPRKFGRPELGPRIPFGRNDVDCIINANILTLLAKQKKAQTKGYKEACRLLAHAIDNNLYGVCGIYYPSHYLLPVRVAELHEHGGRCLTSRHNKVLQYLLDTQHPNGFWVNSPPNRPDSVHSTALALNGLMMLGDPKNPSHRLRVQKGVDYLLKNVSRDRKGHLYWSGQVYFSAVAQARYSVVWRSSSYTTVLAARALQLAKNYETGF